MWDFDEIDCENEETPLQAAVSKIINVLKDTTNEIECHNKFSEFSNMEGKISYLISVTTTFKTLISNFINSKEESLSDEEINMRLEEIYNKIEVETKSISYNELFDSDVENGIDLIDSIENNTSEETGNPADFDF